MKFVADPILDVRRLQYKKEYDDNFAKIRDSRDYPELLKELQRRERKLHNRTLTFLRDNAFYFSRKRNHIMERIAEAVGRYEEGEGLSDEL